MQRATLNKALVSILFAIVLASCSENAPTISQTFWQINLVHDMRTGSDTQIMSVFVMADDEDGLDDIDTMYVINDDKQLFWKLSGDDLRLERFEQSETWVGSYFISMTDGAPIPEGEYRIVLLDSSGERAKNKITVKNGIKEPPDSWPTLVRDEGMLSVKGAAEYVWGMSQDGVVGGEFKVHGDGYVDTAGDEFASYYLYRYLDDLGYGLITGPF